MKKSLLQFVIAGMFFLPSMSIMAQFYGDPATPSRNTIVRSYLGSGLDGRLIYTYYMPSVLGKISLITETDSLWFFLPSRLVIKDMEVFDDWAFFCGSTSNLVGDTQWAVVGQFNIPRVFAGTDSIHILRYPIGVYDSLPVYYNPICFNKLDVFMEPDGPHIALVGDMYVVSGYPDSLFRTTVSYARLYGSHWVFDILYNKYQTIYFEDIACLGDAIFAIGKTKGETLGIALFEQRPFFTRHECRPNTMFRVDVPYEYWLDNYIITKTRHNQSIIAYHSRRHSRTLFHKLEYSTSYNSIVPFLPTIQTEPPTDTTYMYPSAWRLLDLRYSFRMQKAYLLEYADRVGDGSIKTWITSVSATTTETFLNGANPYLPSMTSLDIDLYQGLPILGGFRPGNRLIYSKPFLPEVPGSCRARSGVPCSSVMLDITETTFEYDWSTDTISDQKILPIINSLTVLTDCN